MPDIPDIAARKRRLLFRASHRGTREADKMIGGFVEQRLDLLAVEDVLWFEQLLEETDVDIMSWMTRSQPCPAVYDTALMGDMQKLDFISIAR